MQESTFVGDLAAVLLAATVAGWALQRLGLSSVVGYLVAGILIGPYSPVFTLVSNFDNIQLLSQIGLVFLMFAIGLGLSLVRIQRLGFSLLAAVAISSLLLFNLCRVFGSAMGWDGFQTLFLAGTLMISSSAIIIKVLDETNIAHQRAGQLALGITVLEDVVSIVLLTFFLSMVKVEGSPTHSVWGTLGLLGAFVALLVVASVLLVPRFLKLLGSGSDSSQELRLTAVAGVVLLGAAWAASSGYSMALGAFILGVVLAGTRFKEEVQRSFEAMHNVFGAVFFVSVGMLFDFRTVTQVWGLVLIVTILTLLLRPLCCAFALVAVGHPTRPSLKAGLALIPIGEFAFVMIQVGKSADVLPETFYALAIGVSLATAVIGPLLIRRSDGICQWVDSRLPDLLVETVAYHHRLLAQLQDRAQASLLWKLTSKRVLHIGFHLLLVTAVLIAAQPLYAASLRSVGPNLFFSHGLTLIYWGVVVLIVIGPLIALWGNVEALILIVAEGATQSLPMGQLIEPILVTVLKAISSFLIAAWLLLLIPFGPWVFWTLLFAGLALLLGAPLLWRRLMTLHNRLEVDFREQVRAASVPGASLGLPAAVLEQPQEWNLEIDEFTVPFVTDYAGRPLAELQIRKRFGCSIVAMDRQGFVLTNPPAGERLFPGDKLLLLGASDQLASALQFLRHGSAARPLADLEHFAMETVEVSPQHRWQGLSLGELQWSERFRVQLCAIQRGPQRLLVPPPSERVLPGDRLLVFGTHRQIHQLRADLSDPITTPRNP